MSLPEEPCAKPATRLQRVRALALGVCALYVRGVLLCFVVPLATIVWLVLWPLMRAKRVRLGQLLGWADLNLLALLTHALPRDRERVPWIAVREMPAVTHRVRADDFD